MAFKSWAHVPENLNTKTGWSKLGKNIKKGEVGLVDKVYTYDCWRSFEFFTSDQVEDKRKVNKKPPLEMTIENLATSLYLINKSAKVSRDSKFNFYKIGEHSKVKSAKTRQNNLYELKDRVLTKVLLEDETILQGYHIINGDYYKLIELGKLKFHLPTKKEEVEKLVCLGEIEGTISSEVNPKIKRSVTLTQAKELLNRYLES